MSDLFFFWICIKNLQSIKLEVFSVSPLFCLMLNIFIYYIVEIVCIFRVSSSVAKNQPSKVRGRGNHPKSPRPPIKPTDSHNTVTLDDIKCRNTLLFYSKYIICKKTQVVWKKPECLNMNIADSDLLNLFMSDNRNMSTGSKVSHFQFSN